VGKVLAIMLGVCILLTVPAYPALRVETPDAGAVVSDLLWQNVPTVTFQDRTLTIPPGVSVATDGATYFYGTTRVPGALIPGSVCDAVATASDNALAFIDEVKCRFAAHPSIACSVTTICISATGAVAPYGPPPEVPKEASQTGPGMLAWTPYDFHGRRNEEPREPFNVGGAHAHRDD
jgi:hypothetical protein